ncbi:hypothetical protein ACS0TY_025452 [Phlomoides rotata]
MEKKFFLLLLLLLLLFLFASEMKMVAEGLQKTTCRKPAVINGWKCECQRPC